jgi:2-iminobutanoate/2-iminopropanoate deaminase
VWRYSVKEIVVTSNAPSAIGPYSQAVKVTGSEMLFCSGQIPINPETGTIDSEDIMAQTRQVMQNLVQVVTAAGFELRDVVKTTIYLTDLSLFSQVNEVYASFFDAYFPARSTVQVAALPRGAMAEIKAYAIH